MPFQKVTINTKKSSDSYEIAIGNNIFSDGQVRFKGFEHAKKVAIISNKKIFALYGDAVSNTLRAAGYEVFVHLIGDGERFKDLKTLESALKALGQFGLTRTDGIVALGGGVVGDLAGFAASVYLRGIAFIQIPTSLLAMIDSSVGGKTGVNTSFGKNLVGSFYQPKAVFIDTAFLRTLPKRELTAGFCEAIKQGAIGSKKLLNQTADFLVKHPVSELSGKLNDEDTSASMSDLIASHVSFKSKIVSGDETESVKMLSSRSRKILNFGHTFGHALEKVTNYRYLKHGEAVGHGILFAVELSKRLELLESNVVNLLNDVVRRVGYLPPIDKLDPNEIIDSFKYDKKVVGGSLSWILLKDIGKPVIIDQREIPHKVISTTVKRLIA